MKAVIVRGGLLSNGRAPSFVAVLADGPEAARGGGIGGSAGTNGGECCGEETLLS